MSKKRAPIEVEKIDLEKLKEQVTDIPGLIEYTHSRGGFSVAPTEKGIIKAKSIEAMKEQTQIQLDQILEQMKLLANQAQDLKTRAEVSHQIYGAHMSFEPVVGESYYLYEKEGGERALSLVAPEEWGDSMPFQSFISKVRLMADRTWSIEK